MSAKERTLEVAAFLDSEHARRLGGATPAVWRELAALLHEACYEDLGKVPRLLDGEDVRALLTSVLPGHLRKGDPRAEPALALLEAFLAHLEETQVVPHAYEARVALDDAAGAFLEAVRSGTGTGTRAPRRQAPFVHGATKLGRNDPCSCGSGRKYKHCHGRKG